MQSLLECNHVFYSYHTPAGETPALSDVSFTVRDGEFAVIVGPSGCGKSTLLSLLCSLLAPESGSILLNGRELGRHTDFHIGYMPQKDQLFEWRNIYGNITLGLEIQHQMTSENLVLAEKLMREYGLWEFRHVKPSQLSGGMRQRAALIRTLVLQPSLLLLDEPFSALDYQTRLSVSDDIYQIIKKEHKTAILVTHDLGEAVSMADKILVLSRRPATVIAEIPIELGISDRTPIKSRNAAPFKDYFNQIWKELNEHA
ncbi:MAG: ABC transporter ATP-binding protein [Marvinbryantia sp.]|jgi:NitT/TauT family transport system ATP-binding protein